MRIRLLLLVLLASLCAAPVALADNHTDDDDSAGDDDDSALPDDALTYGWLCGVGPADALPAAPLLLLAGVGLLARRSQR